MLDLNKIYHGDCIDLMRNIPDSSIDMILCDLPYNVTACNWDKPIDLDHLWLQYKRITKDSAAIVLTCTQPFTSKLVSSNTKMFKYEWIWKKSRFANQMCAKFQPLKIHENILVFSKKRHTYNPQNISRCNKITKQGKNITDNNGGNVRESQYFQEFTNYPRSIQEFPSQGNTVHSTQKPVSLFEYLIRTYTDEGELVLDNCAGSGTTAIACMNSNRNYILMEKDEKYFNVSKERIEKHLVLQNNSPAQNGSESIRG